MRIVDLIYCSPHAAGLQVTAMKLKNMTFILVFAPSLANASTVAGTFFKRENNLGCATISAVKDLKQAPLYDLEYERLVGGKGGSADVAVAAVGLGLLSAATAGVASLVIDAVRDPTTPQAGVVAPADGEWRNVKAVTIQMDSGETMQLPLMGQPKLAFGPKYEAGLRVGVYWLKERGSIQLRMTGRVPTPDEKTYLGWCKQMVPKEQATEVFKSFENRVDKDLMVH